MPKIAGGTHFLLLRRKKGGGHTASFTGRFDDSLAKWGYGARISPVFGLNGATAPSLADGAERWLMFAGPVYPAKVDIDTLEVAFLSLGTFNLVVLSSNAEARDRTRAAVKSAGVEWEEWRLVGEELQEVTTSGGSYALPSVILQPLVGLPDALTPTAREYVTVLATAVDRAGLYSANAATDLLEFDAGFRLVMADSGLDPVAKHGLLVNANAALSRYSSQAFTGITPIVETESHFWTHSLLGIGVPAEALMRLRRFVENIFVDEKLIARINALKNLPPFQDNLLSLPGSSEFWDTEHLFAAGVDTALGPHPVASIDPKLPLITCFSGRDGFRSTKISLSAPLEVITACNTVMWTLMTVTHELSHTVIEAALGALLPSPNNVPELSRVVQLLDNPTLLRTRFEQIQAYLCFTLWKLDRGGDRIVVTAQDLGRIIRDGWGALNETLTHVFDFLYFYDRDPGLYVDSIWASWGVIPNIQTRVKSYVLRSLCALYANNIRQTDGVSVTVDQLARLLNDTKTRFSNSLIDAALAMLVDERKSLEDSLRRHANIVKLARAFLYQPRIAKKLREETALGSGDRAGYQLTPKEFEQTGISNPLRFILAFARDDSPDAMRAAWILCQLALGANS